MIIRLILIIIILSFKTNAQNNRKIYKYIQSNQIELAVNEVKLCNSKDINNINKKTLFEIAKCVLMCEKNNDLYNPLNALINFRALFTVKNTDLDLDKIEAFLEKYNLKRQIILEKINFSVYNQLINSQSIEDLDKAIKIVSENYTPELIRLHELLFYKVVKSTKSIDTVRNFIYLYPNSTYKNQVEFILAKNCFNALKSKPNLDGLEKFILEFKNSSFIEIALLMRDSIALPETKTHKNLIEYSKKYPKSKYINSVKEELPNLLYNEIIQNKKINDCKIFIQDYPFNSKIDEVGKIFENLLADSLINCITDTGLTQYKIYFPNSLRIPELYKAYLSSTSPLSKNKKTLNEITKLHINYTNGNIADITSEEYNNFQKVNSTKNKIFKIINNKILFTNGGLIRAFNLNDENLYEYKLDLSCIPENHRFISQWDNIITSENSLFCKNSNYYLFDSENCNSILKFNVGKLDISNCSETYYPSNFDCKDVINPEKSILINGINKLFSIEKNDKLFEYKVESNIKFDVNNINSTIIVASRIHRLSNKSSKSLLLEKIDEKSNKINSFKTYDSDELFGFINNDNNPYEFEVSQVFILSSNEFIVKFKILKTWYKNFSDNNYYSDDLISNTFQIPQNSETICLLKFDENFNIISKKIFGDNNSKMIPCFKDGFIIFNEKGPFISFFDNNLNHKWSNNLSKNNTSTDDKGLKVDLINNNLFVIGSSREAYRLDGESPVIWELDLNGNLINKNIIKLNYDAFLEEILEYNNEVFYVLRDHGGSTLNRLQKGLNIQIKK